MFKKFNFDKKYIKISCYTLFVILIAVLFEKVLDNAAYLTRGINLFYVSAKSILTPFIIGFFIAYLFNPFINKIEIGVGCLLKKIPVKKAFIRNISILLGFIIIAGFCSWILAVFLPEIVDNFSYLVLSISNDGEKLEEIWSYLSQKFTFISESSGYFITAFKKILDPLIDFTKDIPLLLQKVISGTYIAATSILNFILGIVISFYMLSSKESIQNRMRKYTYTFLSEYKANRFLKNASRVHSIFTKFIVGKSLDSLIIGILCFLIMIFIKAPFPTIISVIVGVTNMIPYFGPFIGGIPAVIFVLLVAPKKAILVAISILLLQQLDGLVIGPKILGNSTGLSPLLIIFSIIVGGAIGGPLGMFLGVPVLATFRIFMNEYADRKFERKYGKDKNDTNNKNNVKEENL